MSKYYQIAKTIFPAEWLSNGCSIRQDGHYVLVGSAQFTCDTKEQASRAFNRIAAIMGAEDLCAEPAGESLWKPQAGEAYWTVTASGDVSDWKWNGEQGDELDLEKLAAGLVFRTRAEAEAALAKMNGQEQTETAPETPPELTVDDLAPRKTRVFDDKYWFAVGFCDYAVSWVDDCVDHTRSCLGMAANTRAEARAIADALAVIQETKERSTAPVETEAPKAIVVFGVPFGRFITEEEMRAVWTHIGDSRLINAANWVRGLPLLIENYEDEE